MRTLRPKRRYVAFAAWTLAARGNLGGGETGTRHEKASAPSVRIWAWLIRVARWGDWRGGVVGHCEPPFA
jgi:hypothetical protein